ncbi:hypothetical protein CUC53_17000 [Aeromonas cavernicola]|uniref:Uncharacterized protein n=2 Tax=Aeromonas cavernicola TaxID=1006623 RepID=A0A2H9U0P0_9GAMM|nr:hypothetical protein CUC53_17000 [Aeromonas cavernicola]
MISSSAISGLLFTLFSSAVLAEPAALWLVTLEHNDGLRLQFQGAELELGNATFRGIRGAADLKPGMPLAILSRHGVAEQISLDNEAASTASHWQRAEAPLVAVKGQTLHLNRLGTIGFDAATRWLNGGLGDLQAGRQLVLTRDQTGRLTEILVVNPEDDLASP